MAADIRAILSFISENPVLYAGTIGFDQLPHVHPVSLCYEENGVLYFAAAKCETYYGELSMSPVLSLCAFDRNQGVTLTIKGKAVFTEDEKIVSRCLAENASQNKKWGNDRKMVIAYFLTDVTAEFANEDGTTQTVELETPDSVLIGIQITKDNEIRDRLIKIMKARESEVLSLSDPAAVKRQKLFDGMLLYFAESAKEIWPRMDIGPAERSVLFDTYDEREKYTHIAKKIAGNSRIDKPEDLTYWINRETLDQYAETYLQEVQPM